MLTVHTRNLSFCRVLVKVSLGEALTFFCTYRILHLVREAHRALQYQYNCITVDRNLRIIGVVIQFVATNQSWRRWRWRWMDSRFSWNKHLFAFFLISGRKVSIVTAPFCQATFQFSGLILIFPNSKPSSKGFCGCG
jgi:hypothetical protein